MLRLSLPLFVGLACCASSSLHAQQAQNKGDGQRGGKRTQRGIKHEPGGTDNVKRHVRAPYASGFLRFVARLILRAKRAISAGVRIFSSTIPVRNCSTDPDQSRSIICRTLCAATRFGAIVAS